MCACAVSSHDSLFVCSCLLPFCESTCASVESLLRFLGQQIHLQALDLSHSSFPLDLTDVKVTLAVPLTKLRLCGCRNIRYEGFQALEDLHALRFLDLSFTLLSDCNSLFLESLPMLEELLLLGTRIGDNTAKRLHNKQFIRVLDVQRTAVTPSVVLSLVASYAVYVASDFPPPHLTTILSFVFLRGGYSSSIHQLYALSATWCDRVPCRRDHFLREH